MSDGIIRAKGNEAKHVQKALDVLPSGGGVVFVPPKNHRRIRDYICPECGRSGWRAWIAHDRYGGSF